MPQPVAAPGEARRPIGGLPTAAPRTFPAGGCLGVVSSKASAQYGFSTILSGAWRPLRRAKKLGGHLPGKSRSERLISLLAEAKTSNSLVLNAASGGRHRRRLVGRARTLHWAPAEHENGLLCDLPGRAVLADYAATCLLSSCCRCRDIQWMALSRELDRTKIRATASKTSSNDELPCCLSSFGRGLLETTTNAACCCSLRAVIASAASPPGHRLL